MSTHASGYGELASRLAAAVGLDPNNTQAFTIEVFSDDLIRVRTDQVTTEQAVEEVASVFRTAAESGETPAVGRRPFIPVARLEDIRLRAAVGTLTNAERLALAVLAGGRDGEEGVPALIDAAQEEYGHGSYRVPVRVVGDCKRAKLIFTPPDNHSMSEDQVRLIRQSLDRWVPQWLSGKIAYLCLPAGWSVQAFEFCQATDAGSERANDES